MGRSNVPIQLSSDSSEGENYFAVSLMQHMMVPTFVLDKEQRVAIWNNACERLTGMPAEEVIGTRNHWKGFYSAPRPCLADLVFSGKVEGIDKLYEAYSDTADASLGLSAENWCDMPKTGASLYLAIDAGPVFDQDGRLIAVIETLRDITTRKNDEIAQQKLVFVDGLTGISNRRHFDEILEREWKWAVRSQEPIALLFCDMDYFRRYNDTYGQQRGDDCLRAVANAIRKGLLRPGDSVARYSKDKFAVILPQTDGVSSEHVAKRILDNVRGLNLPHSASKPIRQVTVSIGVAGIIPSAKDEWHNLVEAADQALSRAKQQGRNRWWAAGQT